MIIAENIRSFCEKFTILRLKVYDLLIYKRSLDFETFYHRKSKLYDLPPNVYDYEIGDKVSYYLIVYFAVIV